MFVFNESNKPAPTEVKCYWVKPKFTRVAANRVATVADLGKIKKAPDFDVVNLCSMACSPSAPMSSFKRSWRNVIWPRTRIADGAAKI